MKIKQITETTTAGSIATVNSPLGGTQSRGNPSIYGGKKVGSLFKGKKTSAPYANSINESAELSEAQLEEDDVIVVPGQGRSRKSGFVPHGQSRIDHEVEMARSDLFSAAKNAQQVYSMIKDLSEEEGLDGWVQEKIIKANDYLNTIREYLEGKQVQGMNEGSQRVDSLVTDALKIMRGAEVSDAVRALTTVLGNREYDGRRGYYNFYIKQMIDMYRQQGVAEDDAGDVEKRVLAKIEKEKQRLAKLKQTDPEAYKREIEKRKTSSRIPPVSTFEDQGVAEGLSKSIKRAAQGWGVGGAPDMVTPKGVVQAFGNMDGQRLANFVASRKELSTPSKDSARAFADKVIDREMKQRGYGRVVDKDEQGVAEGTKVDRMVKHIEKSEKKLGKSKDEAENIAWATANKRGMLNNKNKKA